MPAQKKGFFVIKNAEGTVQMNGLTALSNDTNNANFTDATEISQHRDAGNVIRTLTKDMNVYRMTLRLIPGVGTGAADQATLKAQFASLRKGMQVITASFEDGDLNWPDADKAIIVEIGKTLTQGDLMSLDVTVEKYTTAAASPAVIDFTGAWADL